MKYLRPRLPEKEIELCLDLFDKNEAKERILKYIEGVFDDAESQSKNCFINDVMARLFDDVTKNSNADRNRVVAGFDKGKLCFYELDLYEERVKRYLTTVSLNVP